MVCPHLFEAGCCLGHPLLHVQPFPRRPCLQAHDPHLLYLQAGAPAGYLLPGGRSPRIPSRLLSPRRPPSLPPPEGGAGACCLRCLLHCLLPLQSLCFAVTPLNCWRAPHSSAAWCCLHVPHAGLKANTTRPKLSCGKLTSEYHPSLKSSSPNSRFNRSKKCHGVLVNLVLVNLGGDFRSFPLLLRPPLAFAPSSNKRHHHHR